NAGERVLVVAADAAAGLGDPGAGERRPGQADHEALAALRLVITDVLVFTGVPPEEAAAAVRAGTGEFDIPAPPRTPRVPLVSARRRRAARRVRQPRPRPGGRGG
ncbi:hypothetical protein ACFQ11_37665, partial [Actinomadura sediminis]